MISKIFRNILHTNNIYLTIQWRIGVLCHIVINKSLKIFLRRSLIYSSIMKNIISKNQVDFSSLYKYKI